MQFFLSRNADGIASWASAGHAQMKKRHVRLAIGEVGEGSVFGIIIQIIR